MYLAYNDFIIRIRESFVISHGAIVITESFRGSNTPIVIKEGSYVELYENNQVYKGRAKSVSMYIRNLNNTYDFTINIRFDNNVSYSIPQDAIISLSNSKVSSYLRSINCT